MIEHVPIHNSYHHHHHYLDQRVCRAITLMTQGWRTGLMMEVLLTPGGGRTITIVWCCKWRLFIVFFYIFSICCRPGLNRSLIPAYVPCHHSGQLLLPACPPLDKLGSSWPSHSQPLTRASHPSALKPRTDLPQGAQGS